MNPHSRHSHRTPTPPAAAALSLNRIAFSATVHCLTGCAIGEVLGMVIGTAFNLSNAVTIVLSIVLAFFFGYWLTAFPLMRTGMSFARASRIAFASDTASITLMEIIDNAIMIAVPGAMTATLSEPLFWGSLAASLCIAGIAAYPLNRWLIARGLGHALAHGAHR